MRKQDENIKTWVSPKKLPIAHSDWDLIEPYLALLSLVYEESSIIPISLEERELESQDYLTRKYMDLVTPMILEVKGEVVFPLGLYDSEMIVLNYRKFYS